MIEIRATAPGDVTEIRRLMHGLAVYEKLDHLFTVTEADLARDLFGPERAATAILCEADGAAIGFALYYPTYSTFRALRGIYLEDLFVMPEARGQGAGKALLRHLASEALRQGCAYVEWSVLDWNQPAIEFYKSLGATPMDQWTVFRLRDEALTATAQRSPP